MKHDDLDFRRQIRAAFSRVANLHGFTLRKSTLERQRAEVFQAMKMGVCRARFEMEWEMQVNMTRSEKYEPDWKDPWPDLHASVNGLLRTRKTEFNALKLIPMDPALRLVAMEQIMDEVVEPWFASLQVREQIRMVLADTEKQRSLHLVAVRKAYECAGVPIPPPGTLTA